MISLKTVIVNAPDDLRQTLQPLAKMALINRCAGLRPDAVTTVAAAAKHALRAIAQRARRTMRWKPALNAFAITFEGRITPRSTQP
jgi:hypothetical protein